MKIVLKRLRYVLLALTILCFSFLLISFIHHRIRLSKEDKLFVAIGQREEVNGYNLNVYFEGEGTTTLVFMSGGGTCSPILDFKSLYSLLSNEYRIVVVEKAGYGFSDVVDIDRDIDSVLSDTRQALVQAGIQGPYVLCPHSMSGIEALYWAQKYPNEVTAIVGLDMAVPEAYENYKINISLIKLGEFAANIGLTRWIPSLAESDAIKYGTLTAAEKELYKVIFYRRTATKTMINEVQQIKASAVKVSKNGMVNLPILNFSSNGKGTGWEEDQWRRSQSNYIEGCANGRLIKLNCSHYIHDIEYDKIAREIKAFIDSLQ